ncbi:MAG: hypothetical protein R2856_36675 [Caldilineaceae bacterium]
MHELVHEDALGGVAALVEAARALRVDRSFARSCSRRGLNADSSRSLKPPAS